MTPADPRETFATYMRARIPLTFVSAVDELRVQKMFFEAAASNSRTPHIWTITRGFQPPMSSTPPAPTRNSAHVDALIKIQENEDTRAYLIKDFGPFLKDVYVIRALKDLSVRTISGSSLFIMGQDLEVPPELIHHASYIKIPIQSVNEIKEQIHSILERLVPGAKARSMSEEDIEWIARSAVGMSELEIENACALSLVKHLTLDPDVIASFKADLAARGVIDSEDKFLN